MKKCLKYGAAPFDAILHRTEPKGSENAGMMCMPSIEKYHPELAKNLKDEGFRVWTGHYRY